MKFVFVTIICSIVVGLPASAQTSTYLAYLEPHWHESADPNFWLGSVCVAPFEQGQFRNQSKDIDYIVLMKQVLKHFPPELHLKGINNEGGFVEAIVDKTNPENLGQLGFYSMHVWMRNGANSRRALVATQNLDFQILNHEPEELDDRDEAILNERANELWKKHLNELPEKYRPSGYILKTPIVQRVEGAPNILTIRYPMNIYDKSEKGDDRGQMFFIYSQSTHSIIRSEFGHPEWSPGSSVLTIRPHFYFRIGKTSPVMFVGDCKLGWESTS